MYRHHFAIALICLLMLIVGFQNVSAQSQLAQDAYAIFEVSCLNCHGPDGAFRETLLMEHAVLIDGGTVAPGNPNASELYKRLLGPTENGAQMPFGQEPLPAQSIDTVRRWILAGAPDWTAAPITTRRFISPAEVLKAIDTHAKSISAFDRPFARYFTMMHLYNAGVTPDILEGYRKALAKLVNSLSWGLEIVNPQPIDMQQAIFYIDLRHYEWDRNAGWAQIEQAYPYHVEFNAPAQTALRNQLSRLQTTLNTDVPAVNVDWFIAVASSPPLYNNLLSLPERDIELEERLEVNVVDNILTAPGIRVWRAGFTNSGVSNHNRVVDRHTSRYGAYWKSYDFAGSAGTRNVFTHPLAFTHDGGEIIFNLPNGLQGYFLVDGNGARLDAAPISIVSNPAASDPTVRNGLSCIGCHTEGMKEINDEVRSLIENDNNPAYNKAHALQLYVADSIMDSKVNEDLVRYQRALTATGNDVDDVEPISRFHEAFHSPLDLALAAGAVGLQPSVFLSNIRENAGLQSAGLLVLDGGQVKRDTWTSGFEDIIASLDSPTSIGDTPVVEQPDLIPGAPVNIPDSNLRAVIAETLGVQVIRASDMEKLTILRAKDKNISDLTGLEFARNLEELWVVDNHDITDLSPIARCTKLKKISAGHGIKDLSGIANLVNLEWMWLSPHDVLQDLSPFARLTNLRDLTIYGGDLRNISGLENLREMRRLTIKHNAVGSVAPLANMKKLEFLKLHNNRIVDVSPLAELTNLNHLEISGNRIKDISALAALTKLVSLSIGGNYISDLSPLAGLTNLKKLSAYRNNIGDLSPIEHLIPNLEIFNVDDNLPLKGEGGPKIEGPWLWVHFVSTNLSANQDILAQKSLGKVTEIEVATNGATEGNKVGRLAWRSHKIPPTGDRNIDVMFNPHVVDGVLYGVIDVHSPSEQQTLLFIAAAYTLKVWLNGEVVVESYGQDFAGLDYNDAFPVTLRKGRNVLMVAAGTSARGRSNLFVGFEAGTKYSLVPPGITYTFPESDVRVGDTFDIGVRVEEVLDLSGWQFDVGFDPKVLQAVDVLEGEFLRSDGGNAFFQSGRIGDSKITGVSGARFVDEGINGSGVIATIRFKAIGEGDTTVTLNNHLFGTAGGESIVVTPDPIRISVAERSMPADVNRDGIINIFDLIQIAQKLGQSVAAGSAFDVNGDGIVNIFDLIVVASNLGGAAAPPAHGLDAATIKVWIAEARRVADESIAFQQGMANLESLLASMIPTATQLLPNYPNPFNPETWLPYQLAEPAAVSIAIYDMSGQLMRRFDLGYQGAGLYQNRSSAPYWDGRNQRGEPVASGLYFYTLRAGEFTATRRMLIRK